MGENSVLKEQLLALARATGADIKALNAKITTAIASAGENANNASTAEVQKIVSEEIAKIVDGAPETADTLKELAGLIENNTNGVTAITTQINNRLRFDEEQTLTDEQIANVQKSIGLDVQLVTAYETARGEL